MERKITTTVSGGARSYTTQNTVSGGQSITVDEVIPAASNDLPVALALAVAKAKSFCIYSNKDIVIETNSAGSPANTFTITAGEPFIWPIKEGEVFKDTAAANVVDITSLFVSNAGAADARLQIDALVDPT